MYPLSGLEDKVAVVTGAGRMRSIGRPIAVALARAGCDVVLTGTGRSPDRYPEDEKAAGWHDIESVADEVRATGRRAVPVVSDVSDLHAVEDLARRVMEELGRVDVVVNNAGAARGDDRMPVVDLDPELWRWILDVNLTGAFYMSKVFGQRLIDGGRGGSIVNISSIAGKAFSPNTAAYSASKAGLQALTACMAREVGGAGVRVNAICPGVVDTSRMDDLGRGDVWNETISALVPLGRAGTGDDIAHAVVYLCSDEGAWVTGQSWNIDGGTVVQH
jgi:NAD(P)-dependent dehydrogenase (short-subunit alcohol dehydrogenase family)